MTQEEFASIWDKAVEETGGRYDSETNEWIIPNRHKTDKNQND